MGFLGALAGGFAGPIGSWLGHRAQEVSANNERKQKEWEMGAKQRELEAEKQLQAMQEQRRQKAAQIREETKTRFEGYKPSKIESVAETGPVEFKDILARRKAALEGYQAPELAAMQAQMATGQQAGQQQRQRALQAALAKQGIRGGAAAALQAQQGQQAYREKGAMDTEMMLKQEQRKREALGEYGTEVGGAYDREQRRQLQDLAVNLAAEQSSLAQQGLGQSSEEAQNYLNKMAEIYGKPREKILGIF